MKILFIGCVQFSQSCLEALIESGADVVGVLTKQASSFNADFSDLTRMAQDHSIPTYYTKDINGSDSIQWCRSRFPDVLYCFGWPFLLKKEILDLAPQGVVGYHPAALPKNRGRHPIIWALALGLRETASTFFLMDEGADSGDILSQRGIEISRDDNAQTLYEKLTVAAIEQLVDLTHQLKQNDIVRIKQNDAEANLWRKRTKKDGEIDWRMSAEAIYNLVRSLTHPYVGAHCLHEGEEVKVWDSEIADEGTGNLEPGKVLMADPYIIVKCGDGALKILKHGFRTTPQEHKRFCRFKAAGRTPQLCQCPYRPLTSWKGKLTQLTFIRS